MPSEGKVYYYLPHTASRAQLRVRLREAVEGALVLEGVTVEGVTLPLQSTRLR